MAYDPIGVTVDVVTLTIRDGGLHVLLVRRGVPPHQGQWALPRRVRPGRLGRPRRGRHQGTARGNRRAPGQGAPGAARHLRHPGPGSADASDLGGVPGLRPRAARAAGRQRRGGRGVGASRFAWPDRRRRQPACGYHQAARVRPRQNPRRRSRAGQVEARVHARWRPRSSPSRSRSPSCGWCTRPCGANRLHAGNFHRKVLSVPGFVESTGETTQTGGPRGGPRARLYRAGDARLLHPALLRPGREEAVR